MRSLDAGHLADLTYARVLDLIIMKIRYGVTIYEKRVHIVKSAVFVSSLRHQATTAESSQECRRCISLLFG